MTSKAIPRLDDARRAVHAFLDAFERENVHAKVDAVRALAELADAPVTSDAEAVQRLADVRERYDLLRGHQDGIDDVYFPREKHGEQVAVNLELDAIRAAILVATEPAGPRGRDRR